MNNPTIVIKEKTRIISQVKLTASPFVKWVGGKRQLMSELKRIFNFSNFNNFHEPFVGGGSTFISLLGDGKNIGSINDLNEELINTYEVVRDKPDELISKLEVLQSSHNRFQYYDWRKLDRNEEQFKKISKVVRAARFIYLNKTSFNGIYRVNSKNNYNVPLGNPWNRNLAIFNKENILNLSEKLKNSDLKIFNKSYEYILDVAKSGDLVYFDPPYDTFDNDVNFVGYQKEGFTKNDQIKLRDVCDKLVEKGVRVVVSNHSTPFIKNIYSPDKYYVLELVSATRSLNSDSSNRGKQDIEVIIYDKKI